MKTVFIFIFLSINVLIAQDKQGTVMYQAVNIKSLVKNEVDQDKVDDFFKKMELYHLDFEFKLTFSGKEAIFEIIPKMLDSEPENREKNLFYFGIMKTNSLMYQNQDEGVLYYQDFDDKNFYQTKKASDFKWDITSETKMIDGRLCVKAITNLKMKNRRGEFSYPVIAWFCPEIPIPFGPRNFGGLPGLILELEENMYKYYATQINLSEKIAFKKPKIKETISYEEHEMKMIKRSGF